MRFDLTDLRLFLAVVDTGSITRGAAQANLSLAAASERLRAMEASGRVRLLERGRRGTVPTRAGEALVHHARLIFRQMASMQGELGEHAKAIRTTIRLLANTAAMVEYLPGRLAPWLASHPRIDVDLKERQSSDIVKAVSSGLAEIGIISDAVDTAGLQLRPFCLDRLVVVCSRGHPLASKKEMSFASVLHHELVGLAEGALQDYVEGHAARRGKTLKVRVRVRTLEGICQMAAQSVGLGIVPEPAARRCRKSMPITLIRLTDSWATRRLSVCFRAQEDLTPAATDLVAHLSGAVPHPA
jgi:DNA-binding transcriptional LysR family regulator